MRILHADSEEGKLISSAGLSVARIVAIEGDTLVLAGADLVNGTPVLDVKPYLPFCDSVPDAAAPHWVRTRHIKRGSRM